MFLKLTEKIKQEPTIYLFSKFWRHSDGQKLKISLGLVFLFVSFSSAALNPLIFALLLNEIQLNSISQDNIGLLTLYASLLIALALFFSITNMIGNYLKDTAQYISRIQFRYYLLEGILRLPLSWQKEKDSGDLIDKVSKGDNSFRAFGNNFEHSIQVIVTLVSSLAAMVYFQANAIFLILPTLIFIGYIVLKFDVKIIPMQKEINKVQNRVSAKMVDILSNIQSVAILHVEKPLQENVNETTRSSIAVFSKQIKVREYKWGIANILFNALIVFGTLVLYMYAQIDSGEVIQVGTVSALFIYLSRIDGAFHGLMSFYGNLISMKTNMLNIQEIEDDFIDAKGEKEQYRVKESLEIKNLTFTYQNNANEKKGLNDISLSIKKGERIACIGESGSGKTTFLGLIHGLHEQDSGEIRVDGAATTGGFHEIDLSTMLVPQEPELFSSSVRENITFGMEYGDDEIAHMVQVARFTQTLDDLPNGLESVINEKGVNLSGGQKQRLALARALLFAQEKEIILLDESTSSVDPENEIQIYKNIFSEFADTTIIASIHKMNLLKYFDRIIMFDSGKIVDDGSFDELVGRNKTFADMWTDYTKSHQ